ncbi:MAG: hypothetical protein DRO92_01090 [Candidatus Altiarchaeales archaeon]|nr:MAG: hypothetical protein DRO92_01090 [Candidatus Altiarchaeales archaeon]
MKLLISPKNKEEAIEAIKGGADIIDVKNPEEGSLGANFPWVINEIKNVTPRDVEISATIGDFPYLPGTASLAARGVATLGVDYIKVGLYGIENIDQGIKVGNAVVKSVKDYDNNIRVVIAGYADYYKINSVGPEIVLKIAQKSKADFFMLDTAIKNNGNLFSHISKSNLRNLVKKAHNIGILVAVGGSIGKEDIEPLFDTGVDVIGIRGSVCDENNRLDGKIRMERVMELKNIIEGMYRKS